MATLISSPMDHFTLVENAVSVSQVPTFFCEKSMLAYLVFAALVVAHLARPEDHSLVITAHVKPHTGDSLWLKKKDSTSSRNI